MGSDEFDQHAAEGIGNVHGHAIFVAAKRVGRNSEAYCAVGRGMADYAALIRPAGPSRPRGHLRRNIAGQEAVAILIAGDAAHLVHDALVQALVRRCRHCGQSEREHDSAKD